MSFLQELRLQRMKLIEGLDANHGDINLDIFEDFYPDKAHFIYELLQNAEDAEAKNVSFYLNKQGCIFIHDGKRTFTESDVKSITGIHNTTKKNEPDKIGKFGVGFKSVFVYTDTPKIYSQNFSFQIEKLILPSEIEGKPDIGNTTLFEFPFNNMKKTKLESYNDIQDGLNDIAETTLLFLNNIESINWQIDGNKSGKVTKIIHSNHHIETTKIINNATIVSSYFLRYSINVPGVKKQLVAIAYELEYLSDIVTFNSQQPFNKQMKIKSANPGTVAVFFPAKKETSNLRFHVHAPFVPELSRASIKDTPVNEPLFEQLAKLAAESLYKIKELNLLTPEFLSILPNEYDHIPERYEQIRNLIINEMNNSPLTPTYYWSQESTDSLYQKVTTNKSFNKKNQIIYLDINTHAPAKQMIQAKASLKELLSLDDIKEIINFNNTPLIWAVSSQKNSNIDRFLSGLDIKLWDIEQFINLLHVKININNSLINDVFYWFEKKSSEWHQQLYSLIFEEIQGYPEYKRIHYISKLKELRIVRLNNGKHSISDKVFFSNEGVVEDEQFPRVDTKVYSSGKSKIQKENAKKFLDMIGVKHVGEVEQIKAILKNKYSTAANFKQDIKDIERFINLVIKEPDQAKIFESYYIFVAAHASRLFLLI